jgi:hypothetical protein
LPLQTGSLKRCYESMVAGSDDSLCRGELKHKSDCCADCRCCKPAALGVASKREANHGVGYVFCDLHLMTLKRSMRSTALWDLTWGGKAASIMREA